MCIHIDLARLILYRKIKGARAREINLLGARLRPGTRKPSLFGRVPKNRLTRLARKQSSEKWKNQREFYRINPTSIRFYHWCINAPAWQFVAGAPPFGRSERKTFFQKPQKVGQLDTMKEF
jgi:hypothetical protein